MEYNIPLCDTAEFDSYSYYSSLFTPNENNIEDNCPGNAYVDSFETCILDAKYDQVNIHDDAFDKQHLLLDQCQDLFNILSKHKTLFNGSLGVYPNKKVHSDIKPGDKLVHHHA